MPKEAVGNPNAVPDVAEVRQLVLKKLRNYPVRIYLYGSWAAGKAGKTSDIDIAVLPLAPLPKGVLSELRQTLEESNVLFSVDLVDLSEADETFRERVLKEGIEWIG